MRRADAIALIQSHLEELRAMGVGSIALFGSVARDEARPKSDVDALVDLARPLGLMGLMRIRFFLEDLMATRVDDVTRGGLDESTLRNVTREMVRVA